MKKALIISVALIVFLFTFTACTATVPEIIEPDSEVDTLPPNENDGEADGSTDVIAPPNNDERPKPDDSDRDPKPAVVKYIHSKTDALRIRVRPNASSTVLGSIDKGELIAYDGTSGGYYVTRYRDRTAYITASSAYTELIALASSGNEAIERALDIGATLLGVPYELGAQRLHWGNGVMNNRFTGYTYDCSSLMQYIYYKANRTLLDVTTRTQVVQGVYVSKSNLKRGDLMFYTNQYRYNYSGVERIGHVGVYLGDNYMLHTASDHALIEPISSKRWSYYITARRVVY